MAEAADLFEVTLALGDDALVLGHRLSQWSSRGPTLEEDIALSNLALDLIGQARLFYALAGTSEGRGRSEDDLAYLRDATEYRNILMVERPNGDFAATMVRHLLYSAASHPYFEKLGGSTHSGVAEIGAKAAKEMAYHVRHAAEWVIRLGDGTDESRARTLAALDDQWPYTSELWQQTDAEHRLVEVGALPDRIGLRGGWDQTVDQVLKEAGLARPQPLKGTSPTGGRAGRHTEHLAPMLAEMQSIARAHPGATW